MNDTIRRLRAILPPLLTLEQYCDLTHRCLASAYNDLRNQPGLAIKIAGSTRVLRDRVLAKMARSEWRPQKDRLGAAVARAAKPKKSRQPRRRHDKQPGTPRDERDPEVRL